MPFKHSCLILLLALSSCVRPALPVASQYTPPTPAGDQAQDGITDERDQCPSEPEDLDGFYDEDGCPEPDNDNDLVLDEVDQCPNDPEDFDGFEDENGCPDRDNDRDTILDSDDKCPNEPEDFDDDNDEDGCPEKDPRVELWCTTLTTVTVLFEFQKSQLDLEGMETLNTAAAHLSTYPARMTIVGQAAPAESRSSSVRERLALKRANAVRDYLVKNGVDPATLEVRGYAINDPDGVPSAAFFMCASPLTPPR